MVARRRRLRSRLQARADYGRVRRGLHRRQPRARALPRARRARCRRRPAHAGRALLPTSTRSSMASSASISVRRAFSCIGAGSSARSEERLAYMPLARFRSTIRREIYRLTAATDPGGDARPPRPRVARLRRRSVTSSARPRTRRLPAPPDREPGTIPRRPRSSPRRRVPRRPPREILYADLDPPSSGPSAALRPADYPGRSSACSAPVRRYSGQKSGGTRSRPAGLRPASRRSPAPPPRARRSRPTAPPRARRGSPSPAALDDLVARA